MSTLVVDAGGVATWKRWLMHAFDSVFLRVPFTTEFLNQGVSKNLGILAGWHLLSRIGVEGDYLEFGVFQGETFRNSILAARNAYRATEAGRFTGRFLAFDSFEGLPAVTSSTDDSRFYSPGQFRSERTQFERTVGGLLRKYPVEIVPGWFDRTLNDATAQKIGLRKAAFVNVDCDLYESTVPILKFITPYLQTGTVIYFDDWFSIRGSMDEGEPRACREWLERHPDISLVDYRTVGITGKMFLVNRKSPRSA